MSKLGFIEGTCELTGKGFQIPDLRVETCSSHSVRDIALLDGMDTARIYVRRPPGADFADMIESLAFLGFPVDVKWRDDFRRIASRLAQADIRITDCQVTWNSGRGWDKRMKLYPGFEDRKSPDMRESFAVWRVMGASVDMASRLAADTTSEDWDVEHIAGFYDENMCFTGGELYVDLKDRIADECSVERSVNDPDRIVTCDYMMWNNPLTAETLARFFRGSREKARAWFEAMGTEKATAITGLKTDRCGSVRRGIAIERYRPEMDGLTSF